MKISIVVPVYNAEKYLEECIQSVVNQINPNWELMLVDDGSTDKSFAICDSFAQKYPDKIFSFHKHNEGQFLTRKYGIEKCTGEYIGFLDADDLLADTYIESLISAIEEASHPDAICFNFAQFSEDEFRNSLNVKNNIFETNEQKRELCQQIAAGVITGSLCSKVFKSDFLKSVSICETEVSVKRFGEDAYHSFAALLSAERVGFIENILYYYRDNSEGASLGYDVRDFDYFSIKYVFSLIESFLLENYSDDVDLFKQLYAHNFNATVNHMLKFYRSTGSLNRKKQLIEYDWHSYLLDKTVKHIENNEYIRASYVKVWKAFCNKKYAEIFIREKLKNSIGW